MNDKTFLRVIIGLSLLIPIAVAILIFTPYKTSFGELDWIRALPGFHALVNSVTAILLIGAVIAIKKGMITLHKRLMLLCFFMGALFLASYILYHSSVDTTIYGDLDHNGELSLQELEALGVWRSVYLFTLFSHILLSIVVVPFVLLAFYYALTNKIEKHKKIVKGTFPIWLYVSVTGVLVYLMISPYYL
ncbi:MAG: DUF420 domain-containing protein [Cyclobacteriaceae bacterium]